MTASAHCVGVARSPADSTVMLRMMPPAPTVTVTRRSGDVTALGDLGQFGPQFLGALAQLRGSRAQLPGEGRRVEVRLHVPYPSRNAFRPAFGP